MEIRNLNTFLQVAAIQNFTQAARLLGYSQSNVSAQIQQLEQDVGAPLFDRIGRSVTLTQYGRNLLPFAQQIVTTAFRMENLCRSETAMTGTIRIGIVESLFEVFFEAAIQRYHHRFPHVKVELTVDAASTLQELLKKNQIDFACLIDDPLLLTEWNCWYSLQVSIVIASNPTNALTLKKQVDFDDLKNQEFILMEESATYSINFIRSMAARGIEVNPFLILQNARIARRLVENGDYITVLPIYSVKEAIEKGSVTLLKNLDYEQHQNVQFILHRNKVLTPLIEGFLEELRNEVQDFSQYGD
jgi:DNA-binding transcriptional LysR family regulator